MDMQAQDDRHQVTSRDRAETVTVLLAAAKAIGINSGAVKRGDRTLLGSIDPKDKIPPHDRIDYSGLVESNSLTKNLSMLEKALAEFNVQDLNLSGRGEQSLAEANPNQGCYIKALRGLVKIYTTSVKQVCAANRAADYNQPISNQSIAVLRAVSANIWKALVRTISSECKRGGVLEDVRMTMQFRDGEVDKPDELEKTIRVRSGPKRDLRDEDLVEPDRI